MSRIVIRFIRRLDKMSTPAMIGIKQKDGIIRAIYCHNDGSPDIVGECLRKYYCNADRVNLLIDGGDISSLGPSLLPDPNYEHTFANSQDDVTVFYYRDRGDTWDDCYPTEYADVSSFVSAISVAYHYLFDVGTNQWTTYD